jgi:hypothetical protein
MTNPTFRALCAELVETLSKYHDRLEETYHSDSAEAKELDAGFGVLERARAALAQPEPVPTDEALRAFYDSEGNDEDEWPWWHRIFLILLTRYARPAIQPVPVSERLPGAEDCAPWPDEPDATNWCWAAKCVSGGWEWTQLSMLGLGFDALGRIIAGGGWTHWLPHWALPLPTSTNTINQEDYDHG